MACTSIGRFNHKVQFIIKGAVSSIFSVTVKSQKTHFYLWKPKNNGLVVLKWVFQYMETIISMSGEGWPGWKWRSTWKRLAEFFKFLPYVSDKIFKN